jgi:hypothetical protein
MARSVPLFHVHVTTNSILSQRLLQVTAKKINRPVLLYPAPSPCSGSREKWNTVTWRHFPNFLQSLSSLLRRLQASSLKCNRNISDSTTVIIVLTRATFFNRTESHYAVTRHLLRGHERVNVMSSRVHCCKREAWLPETKICRLFLSIG